MRQVRDKFGLTDEFVFTSGRKFSAQAIGLSSAGFVYVGDDPIQMDPPLTQKEERELATFMINRWLKWSKDSLVFGEDYLLADVKRRKAKLKDDLAHDTGEHYKKNWYPKGVK